MAFFRCIGSTGGGGDMTIENTDGVYVNRSGIVLPYKLSGNYRLFIDFTISGYVDQLQFIGNTDYSPSHTYSGFWSNRLYVRTTSGEQYMNPVSSSYWESWDGRHTTDINNNGAIIIDGKTWLTGQAIETNNNMTYTIGKRGAVDFTGTLHRFFIYDNVNEEYVCDLIPKVIMKNGNEFVKFMYDRINDVVYTVGG